jgi:glyoxylase-like metal-dependent hydrolase (beta-lactamase superfamily II)
MTGTPEQQVPPVYHRRVGDIVITTLCDGYIDVPPESLSNPTGIPTAELLQKGFQNERPRITVNTFLIRSGGRTAIIETGTGKALGPTLGWLPGNLERAGISPDEIDTVMLTHMHPDHSNGLLDDDGKPFFRNATVRMHENEAAHWQSDERMAQAKDRQVYYFTSARQSLTPCLPQLETFAGETEVFPGVTTFPIPGHTPGHTAYRISSGGEQVMIWGDIVHVPEVQIPNPDVGIAFDTDTQAAIATRKRILDMVATDRLMVGGMHIGFPGFAHVVRSGGTYALVPEVWRLGM